MSLQCDLAAKKVNRTLGYINSTARRLRMWFFSLTHSTTVLYLSYCIQLWAPNTGKIPRNWRKFTGTTKMLRGKTSCPDRRDWNEGACSFWRRKTLWAGGSRAPYDLWRGYIYRCNFFMVVDGERMTDNGYKLKQGKSKLDVKTLFHDEDSQPEKRLCSLWLWTCLRSCWKKSPRKPVWSNGWLSLEQEFRPEISWSSFSPEFHDKLIF